jgi:hypothetical protein
VEFKLIDCDDSDFELWVDSPVTASLRLELVERRDRAIKNLIKSPSEEKAEKVRVFDVVIEMLNERK